MSSGFFNWQKKNHILTTPTSCDKVRTNLFQAALGLYITRSANSESPNHTSVLIRVFAIHSFCFSKYYTQCVNSKFDWSKLCSSQQKKKRKKERKKILRVNKTLRKVKTIDLVDFDFE